MTKKSANKSKKLGFLVKTILILGVAFLFNTGAARFLAAQQKSVYTVKAGDTFYSISKTLKVSIAELKQWNDLPQESNYLATGQELVYYIAGREAPELPIEEPPVEEDVPSLVQSQPDAAGSYYLVKSGDTLFGIARLNGMSINELKALNGLSGDNIRVGQRLVVKSVSAAPVVNEFSDESSTQGRFVLYTLSRNDNLNAILSRFKMTAEELQALNPDINIQQLNLANKITVLLPPSKNFENPYRSESGLQDLGTVGVSRYETESIGKTTTNGELYNPDELTAAHSNISLGSIIFVENPVNGKGVYVRVNDRITGSGIKLSNRAFQVLGFADSSSREATIFTNN